MMVTGADSRPTEMGPTENWFTTTTFAYRELINFTLARCAPQGNRNEAFLNTQDQNHSAVWPVPCIVLWIAFNKTRPEKLDNIKIMRYILF